MIVDSQVYRVPANATVAVLAFACDAVAYAPNTAQPFHVDVQQLARALALITHDGRARLQRRQPTQPQPCDVTRHGRQAATGLTRDAPQRRSLAAALFELADLRGATGGWAARRSAGAIAQSALKRASHLYPVRWLTPAAWLASATFQP